MLIRNKKNEHRRKVGHRWLLRGTRGIRSLSLLLDQAKVCKQVGYSFFTFLDIYTKKKEELLATGKIRLLYSSMSFLYLLKTDKSTVDSLVLMNDLITLARPKFVGIDSNQADFEKKYMKYIKSPEFTQDMKKVQFLIATKKADELAAFKSNWWLSRLDFT
jgi:hypothetical protein